MATFTAPTCHIHGPRISRRHAAIIKTPRAQRRCCTAAQQRCQATQDSQAEWPQSWKTKIAAAGAAAALAFGVVSPVVLANEFDLLSEQKPTSNYLIDDAGVLNRTTKKSVNDQLARLEIETGFRLEVATVRKLETESDAFAFGDKLIENWYENVEKGSDKGILLVVTSGKDGALTGGPKFLKAIGNQAIDSIVSENIPILTTEEKYNETITSSVDRVAAILKGQTDPGPPVRDSGERKRTYRTKGETEKSKNITGTIVLVLLGVAFIVPMVQYFGYTKS